MVFPFTEKWRTRKAEMVTEFYSYIEELLEHEMVARLDNFIHHHCYTRLRHSLDVAYYSFFIAKLFHLNVRSVARAGLLHDLFHYIRTQEDFPAGSGHSKAHPRIALENAKSICTLSEIEEDIILKHMWLVTLPFPRYKESFVVTFVDKICAVSEFSKSVFSPGLRTVFG
ncbi:MAG: HD domain-containing protein [Oscillospiraceae bacterium]|nr:HD domain-containing protein [Oscillospiraceae bacterium]